MRREDLSYGSGGTNFRSRARAERRPAPRALGRRRWRNGRLSRLRPSSRLEPDRDSLRAGSRRFGWHLHYCGNRGGATLGVPNAAPSHLSARARLRTGADLPVPRCLSPSRKTRRALAARARRRHRVANRRWATAGAGGRPWPALWLAEARAESFLGRRSAVRDIAAG